MLFNTIDFAIFLPIVFFLYWFVFSQNLRNQNTLVVIASYVFYGWWDWRFLGLIFFSTLIDFFVGIKLKSTKRQSLRKRYLWISILVNLGLLGYFKYSNFFLENFNQAFSFLGMSIKSNSLNIILPVGISFYTFQTLSYTIDVYRGKLEPTRNFVSFSAFVSFFPQLVAGPIERATNLLPQFFQPRRFEYSKAVDGLRQILWGLFKKVVIADNCAKYVDVVFSDTTSYSGITLLFGAFFFAFQIYGDFSGYSDIAIGTSRLFGFNLKRNFAFPYFSRDIAEFWRRWHISLSTWFRDYLYIPLGGSKVGASLKLRNTFIIFLVSGFWHGANWTFIVWGALNAIYFVPLLLTNKNRRHLEIVASDKSLPTSREFFSILLTFILTVFAWIIFRADSIDHALIYFYRMLSGPLIFFPQLAVSKLLLLLAIFITTEWIGRKGNYALELIGIRWRKTPRYLMYYLIIAMIFWFGGDKEQFIYFQF